jgi:hypothetical protein
VSPVIGPDALRLADAASRPLVPAAVHFANCLRVRALIADEFDADDLADEMGLNAPMPEVVTRDRARHYRAHMLPVAYTVGRMI